MTSQRAHRLATRTTARAAGVLLAAGLLGGVVASSPAEAKADPKVGICHATSSTSNPYITLLVKQSSLDGNGKNDHTGHHGGLFDFSDPAANSAWGDIIPAGPGVLFSMNATIDGLGIFANGCNGPEQGSCPDGSAPVGGQCSSVEVCPDGSALVDGDCPDELESTDGGTTDGGTTDGGAVVTDDGGTTDDGTSDGGSTDGGTTDGESTDGDAVVTDDGGSTDGGSTDGGTTDGESTDGDAVVNDDGGSTDGGTTGGGSTGGTDRGAVSETTDAGATDGTDGGTTDGGSAVTDDGGSPDGGSDGIVVTDDGGTTDASGNVSTGGDKVISSSSTSADTADEAAGSGTEVQGLVVWGSTADHSTSLPLTGASSIPMAIAGVVLVTLGVALAVWARLSRA